MCAPRICLWVAGARTLCVDVRKGWAAWVVTRDSFSGSGSVLPQSPQEEQDLLLLISALAGGKCVLELRQS